MELGISLDGLLYNMEDQILLPFQMNTPRMSTSSMDTLLDKVDNNLNIYNANISESAFMSTLFDIIPLEFYVHYPALCKFMDFKWGYYFIDTEEFNNYSSWILPKRLENYHNLTKNVCNRYEHILYIWDISTIWNLCKEIKYLFNAYAISKSDFEAVKKDLRDMLTGLERVAARNSTRYAYPDKIDIYITNINVGIYCSYSLSGKYSLCSFTKEFLQSPISEDRITCMKVKAWIDSLKKISTLVSGSGEKNRKFFFEEQRSIVDNT